MKKLLVYLLLISTSLGFAQRGINYSAIIKDNSGTVLTNQNVTLEFSILQGVSQMVVYTETHSATTNAHGYINAVIGQGTPTLGTYSAVSWGSDIHFINTSVNTGSGFVSLGITELKAVPYALYAETSGGSSNGAFTSSAGVTKITTETDDFLLGSNQLNYSGAGIDSKAFYDEGLGAFRVGGVTSNNWDTSNIGLRSFASGLNTRATLANATAFGDNSQATGQTSFVMGTNTQASALNTFAGGNTSIASGSNSFAYGNNNSAIGLFTTSFGERTTAQARGSFVIGRFNEVNGNGNTWVATDPLFVVGNGTSDTNRSNALTVYKDGSLETGGLFTIGDPINGNSYTFPAEDATAAGQVLTSDGNGQLAWQTISSNSIADADGDTSISLDDGSDSDQVEIKANGTTEMVLDQTGFIFGSDEREYNAVKMNLRRMFFDKQKSAFRGGRDEGNNWSFADLGFNSFAYGSEVKATGFSSFAFGSFVTSSHQQSSTMGLSLESSSPNSLTIGRWNDVAPNSLFVVGNGIDSSSKSNAFVVQNNGDVKINNLASPITQNVEVLPDGTLIKVPKFKTLSFSGADVVPANSNETYTINNGRLTATVNNFIGYLSLKIPAVNSVTSIKRIQVMVKSQNTLASNFSVTNLLLYDDISVLLSNTSLSVSGINSNVSILDTNAINIAMNESSAYLLNINLALDSTLIGVIVLYEE